MPTPLHLAPGLLSRVARLLELPSRQLIHPFLDPSLARPLILPSHLRVCGVGSAVLGGAGKTPVAIEIAKQLERDGHSVAFVSHAYRASPHAVMRVTPHCSVQQVGDDALLAAHALHATTIPVFVGPNRQQTLDHAARCASWVVIDGLLQSRPHRLAHSVLVVDAYAPFGSGRVLPLGDLRASPHACLAACDEVVVLSDVARPTELPTALTVAKLHRLASLDLSAAPFDFDALRSLKVGLITGLGRPHRLVDSLRARGVVPQVVHFSPDHEGISASALEQFNRARLDLWLVSNKAALHLTQRQSSCPLVVLQPITHLDPCAKPW